MLVGEGQKTEPNYFRCLAAEPEVTREFAITVKKGHGISQDAVVREAIDYRRNSEYDEVWCVVDVEGPSKAANLAKAIALAAKHKITLWLSNPSIEVWFLLHLTRQARPYLDGDAAETELNKQWSTHFNRDYAKGDEAIYPSLRGYMNIALANAQWVLEQHHQNGDCKQCNSSTEIYLLVRRLLPDGITAYQVRHLQVGNMAPEVTLPDQNGRSIKLSSLRGKSVVLCFYPTIDERASATEAAGFRDTQDQFAAANIVTIGITPDTCAALKAFVDEHTIETPFLSDQDHNTAQKYGVFVDNNHLGRTTFVIGPDGVILHVYRDFDVQTHATQILATLQAVANQSDPPQTDKI